MICQKKNLHREAHQLALMNFLIKKKGLGSRRQALDQGTESEKSENPRDGGWAKITSMSQKIEI